MFSAYILAGVIFLAAFVSVLVIQYFALRLRNGLSSWECLALAFTRVAGGFALLFGIAGIGYLSSGLLGEDGSQFLAKDKVKVGIVYLVISAGLTGLAVVIARRLNR